MDFREWANLGVSVACLAALAWAVWQSLKWLRVKADGLIAAHLKLIEILQAESPKQTAALNQQTILLSGVVTSTREIRDGQKGMAVIEEDCVGHLKIVAEETRKQTAELVKQSEQLAEHRAAMETHGPPRRAKP